MARLDGARHQPAAHLGDPVKVIRAGDAHVVGQTRKTGGYFPRADEDPANFAEAFETEDTRRNLRPDDAVLVPTTGANPAFIVAMDSLLPTESPSTGANQLYA